jgi:hypothetical protein
MQIKVQNLRGLIKLLLETPLEDILPIVDKSRPGQLYNPNQIKKFFSSEKFKSDAIKAYSLFNTSVYVIPVVSGDSGISQRTKIFNEKDKIFKILSKCQLSDEKTSELMSALSNDATIFITKASMLEKGYLPSIWMMLHAMIDDQKRVVLSDLSSSLDKLVNELGEKCKILGMCKDENDIGTLFFTMKSARMNDIGGLKDLVAEIVCQEILTYEGFHFKKSENDDVNDILLQISHCVKDARKQFENEIKGCLLIVNTASEA